MLTGGFDQLFAAGCIQTGADIHDDAATARPAFFDLFHALMNATRGNICDGCPAFKGGSCAAYRQFNTAARSPVRVTVDAPIYRSRCKVCGLKIRGANHENGEHHQKAKKLSGAA